MTSPTKKHAQDVVDSANKKLKTEKNPDRKHYLKIVKEEFGKLVNKL